jgi:mannose PTS system EIIA component
MPGSVRDCVHINSHDGEKMTERPEKKSGESATEGGRVAGIIVTHGHLAGELLAAAEMIVGPVKHITSVSIGWHDDVDMAHNEIERAIQRVSEKRGVLILTDMFGGTPTNIASMFLSEGEVEVVTGVNLPMVIKLASQQGATYWPRRRRAEWSSVAWRSSTAWACMPAPPRRWSGWRVNSRARLSLSASTEAPWLMQNLSSAY